jgi:hypothetical protein
MHSDHSLLFVAVDEVSKDREIPTLCRTDTLDLTAIEHNTQTLVKKRTYRNVFCAIRPPGHHAGTINGTHEFHYQELISLSFFLTSHLSNIWPLSFFTITLLLLFVLFLFQTFLSLSQKHMKEEQCEHSSYERKYYTRSKHVLLTSDTSKWCDFYQPHSSAYDDACWIISRSEWTRISFESGILYH